MTGPRRAALGLLAALACACQHGLETEPAPRRAVLLVTSELEGSLGPCGCSEAMRGGIDRLATLVRGEFAAAADAGVPVVLLDLGNTFHAREVATLSEELRPVEALKARTLRQALLGLGLQGSVPGPFDPAWPTDAGWPVLPPSSVVTLSGGLKLGLARGSTAPALREAAARVRLSGAQVVVGFFEGPLPAAAGLAQEADPELDLVLARAQDLAAGEALHAVAGAVPVLQLESRGRAVLRVDLQVRGRQRVTWQQAGQERGRELQALAQRVELLKAQVNDPGAAPSLLELKRAKLAEVMARRQALLEERPPPPGEGSWASWDALPVETTIPPAPDVKALLASHDRQVGELNLAHARAHGRPCDPPAPDEAYVGDVVCAACHPAAAQVWTGTKHARAYQALVEVGKQHHLDCVGCHVTAWQRPGGVCRLDRLEGSLDVRCESCHGPGALHSRVPIKGNIPIARDGATCLGCHDRENSPYFDFEKYRLAVIGPGHGLPLPEPQPAPSPTPSPARPRARPPRAGR